MRYTKTISIPWHNLNGEKPCPNRNIVVKRSGANTLYAPKDIVHAADVPQALAKYDRYDEWAYADETWKTRLQEFVNSKPCIRKGGNV